MNLNPAYFNDLTLAELLKMVRAGKSFESKMGLKLSKHPVERQVEMSIRTEKGYVVQDRFAMTQKGLEEAIVAGLRALEEADSQLMGYQVYSFGETYNRMSHEFLALDEALAELQEAETYESDQEWSLKPVYFSDAPVAAMNSQVARA